MLRSNHRQRTEKTCFWHNHRLQLTETAVALLELQKEFWGTFLLIGSVLAVSAAEPSARSRPWECE